MNHSFKIPVIVFLLISSTLALTSCKKKDTLPTLTTISVSGITQTSAVSGGNVTSDGGVEVTARGVCWGISHNPVTGSSETSNGAGTGTFTSSITGLMANTIYNVRAYATNSQGTSYGNEVSFATSTINVATLTTVDMTSITPTTAISGGDITDDGGGTITARGVCWSTAQNPTTADNKTTDGSGTGDFTSNLTGLNATVSYYVRAYATNSAGTAYGNELNFITTGELATLTTDQVWDITQATAKCEIEIAYDGGYPITNSGLCWSKSQNPTIADSKTTGNYFWISGLNEGTTYYLRGYATNNAGTAYGNQVNFTTLPGGPIIFNQNLTYSTIPDIEGNVYKTIQIGTQTWMAENLKTTKLNDYTVIENVTINNEWINLSSPGYCWYNNSEMPYKAEYGAMYNWFAINTGKLCPTGWHIPSAGEFYTLVTFAGDENTAGAKLKETGTTHWDSSNQIPAPTNETGFTVLPGGERSGSNGTFSWIGEYCNMWTSDLDMPPNDVAYLFYFNYASYAYRENTSGFSVRCIKN